MYFRDFKVRSIIGKTYFLDALKICPQPTSFKPLIASVLDIPLGPPPSNYLSKNKCGLIKTNWQQYWQHNCNTIKLNFLFRALYICQPLLMQHEDSCNSCANDFNDLVVLHISLSYTSMLGSEYITHNLDITKTTLANLEQQPSGCHVLEIVLIKFTVAPTSLNSQRKVLICYV